VVAVGAVVYYVVSVLNRGPAMITYTGVRGSRTHRGVSRRQKGGRYGDN